MREFVEISIPCNYANLESDFIEYSHINVYNYHIKSIYKNPSEYKCRLLHLMLEIYNDFGGYYHNIKLKRVNNSKFILYGNAQFLEEKYFIKITSELEMYVQSEKEIKEYLDINNLWEKL